MTPLKDPVIFHILDTGFVVDIDQQVLRQTNNPANTISFIEDMQDHGIYYRFLYDATARTVAADPDADRPIKLVTIPTMAELDPEGMSIRYGIPVAQLKGKTDFEIIVDQDLLARRHQGVLPQIDIHGEFFVVDLKLHELRHAKNFFPVISLKSFDLTDDGAHYTAFYDTLMKQAVQIDPKLLEMPDYVVQIKLPNEIGLDPVFTAQKYGINERDLLRRHPINRELKALVVPLGDTDIPRLIRQNKDELRRQHEETMQRVKPRHRPRF